MFDPRPGQQEVLEYRRGLLGVSAVPGSGKTAVLSALAARLVAEEVDADQEVLVVTLVNSAVDNFSSRITQLLAERDPLLVGAGYRVRTLHGLSNDIVRERPGLVGLAADFGIADEAETVRILEDAVRTWLERHPELFARYVSSDLDDGLRRRLLRQEWPVELCAVAASFIRVAKDRLLEPERLRSLMKDSRDGQALGELCLDVYGDYQQALRYRGKLDFDDLVTKAISALRIDGDYLCSLRRRWPFILEDEAQDSSRLQQELLELLVGPAGNWVRVGDTNQSVYGTFTTADTALMRSFLERPTVSVVEMNVSGRSGPPIIALANRLVDWAATEHPLPEVREAFRRQHIEAAGPEDPQPNPSPGECQVYFQTQSCTPRGELSLVVDSLARWLPEHGDQTVAVLVPDNHRGTEYVDAFHKRCLPCVELLRSRGATRQSADVVADVLTHLSSPHESSTAGAAFEAWCWHQELDEKTRRRVKALARAISRCRHIEDVLQGGDGAAPGLHAVAEQESDRRLITEFARTTHRWHGVSGLPVDQLVLSVAQDLFDEPADLARAYRFAIILRGYADDHRDWRLAELAGELRAIARNERKFTGLSSEDTGFDPERYRGQVVVSTMHSAKGLEFDRVYVTAVNSYDFPSGAGTDRFRGEKWYIDGEIDLQAEALDQLHTLDLPDSSTQEGNASSNARLAYIRERLRLLYVAITRAKRDLIVTWNTGRRQQDPKQPALAFQVLRAFWEQESASASGGGRPKEGADGAA